MTLCGGSRHSSGNVTEVMRPRPLLKVKGMRAENRSRLLTHS